MPKRKYNDQGARGKPISLHPLSLEEALASALATPWPPADEESEAGLAEEQEEARE